MKYLKYITFFLVIVVLFSCGGIKNNSKEKIEAVLKLAIAEDASEAKIYWIAGLKNMEKKQKLRN